MPAYDRDPLAATTRLIIDGTNLLHAMSRTPAPAPRSALVGRLRAAIPAPIAIELVFDGPSEPGLRGQRIASGITVRYGGPRSADAVILAAVDEVRKAGTAEDTAALLVITDDRDLRYGVRLRGARTARATWLLGRLGARRSAAASIGNPRPPRPPRPATPARTGQPGGGRPAGGHPGSRAGGPSSHPGNPGEADDLEDADDRPGWKPGRGATTKRGNPRKAPRTASKGARPEPDW